MGADWSVWLVKKVDGVWTPVRPSVDEAGPPYLWCFTGRHYSLFGEIGGVRGKAGNTANRGWFVEMDESLKAILMSGCYHSATWVTMKEMEKAFKKCKAVLPEREIDLYGRDFYNYGNDYRPVKRYIETEEAEAILLGLPMPEFLLFIAFDS